MCCLTGRARQELGVGVRPGFDDAAGFKRVLGGLGRSAACASTGTFDQEDNHDRPDRDGGQTQGKPKCPTGAKPPSCYLSNVGKRNAHLSSVALARRSYEGVCP